MFYFQQMFMNALNGIDSQNITSGVVGIASTILILSFLYGAYQAFASGGDVRALGIAGIKYLLLGLVFANYGSIFRDINTMFNSVALSITNLASATDMFSNWMTQLQTYWSTNGTQSLWSIIGGVGASLSGLLDAALVIVAFILMPITYALFALFYSLYGSVLYVTGPFVLALLPANGVGQLARTYLVNMLVFQAWGLLYAIFSALMVVLNVNSVNNVLNSGGVAGFFQNASQDLLLALASILFSICIALIPFMASRIIKGDVGSTVLVLLRSATWSGKMTGKL
jgi:hypothetical protein